MTSTTELLELLLDFNKQGYADESVKYESNGKDGKLLRKVKGNITYEDEFYGGEPYSGNETIWEDNKAIFRCVYWGMVMKGEKFEQIYNFLRKALRQGPTGKCVDRGPESYTEGELEYRNECVGTIENFQQIERILKNGEEIYVAYFNGGRINVGS